MFFFFKAEDGIRDLVRSRGLGDVYKRQVAKLSKAETSDTLSTKDHPVLVEPWVLPEPLLPVAIHAKSKACLLYTSDAADERSSVDLGGRRIIKKKKIINTRSMSQY